MNLNYRKIEFDNKQIYSSNKTIKTYNNKLGEIYV